MKWTLKDVGKAAFPDYRGRKFRLVTDYFPKEINSYWDGGSRDYYCFLNLQNGKIVGVHSNHPAFEAKFPNKVPVELPPEIVLVEHSIFCGKDVGISVYAKPNEYLALETPKTPLAQILDNNLL